MPAEEATARSSARARRTAAHAGGHRGARARRVGQPDRGGAPEYRMIENLRSPPTSWARGAGFTVAQVAPRHPARHERRDRARRRTGEREHALRATPRRSSLDPQAVGYPGSLMGAIAVARQAFLDAKWYRDANAAYAPGLRHAAPRRTCHVGRAAGDRRRAQSVQFVADEMLEVLRSAGDHARPGSPAASDGGRRVQRLSSVAALGLVAARRAVCSSPTRRTVTPPDVASDVATETLRQWQEAPGNARRQGRRDVRVLTANGLRDVKLFPENVGKAIQRGLSADAALAAVDDDARELLGSTRASATIAPGKIANFTVTRGAVPRAARSARCGWTATATRSRRTRPRRRATGCSISKGQSR